MVKIPNNLQNIARCMCPECPVQLGSECVNAKRGHWQEMSDQADLIASEGDGSMASNMRVADMIGVYCSIGKSNCPDLDEDLACICPSCAVWNEYGLGQYKYCLEGSAEQRGE